MSLTKAQLFAAIRDNGRAALETLRALPAGQYSIVRFENGWTGRHNLGHMAGIEAIYPLYIKLAELGPPVEHADAELRWLSVEEAPDVPTVIAPGGIDALNARIVAQREPRTVEELLAEFEARRAVTLTAVEAADEALLSVRLRTLGGVTGSLWAVMHRIAVEHIEEHVRDICGEEQPS
jgi:hypothetical protein